MEADEKTKEKRMRALVLLLPRVDHWDKSHRQDALLLDFARVFLQ